MITPLWQSWWHSPHLRAGGREIQRQRCKATPQSAKAIPAHAHADCTNKTAAPPQWCWCQEFIVRLHLKSLPKPRRGEAAAAWLPGWREEERKKSLLLGQIKQWEAGFRLMVLPSSVFWENQSPPQRPATTTGSPGRDTAQEQPTHPQGAAAITGRMLRGPWTIWNNLLLRWDAG